MKVSSKISTTLNQSDTTRFVEMANAAMRRAFRLVTAENKRLGLPLIADKIPRRVPTHRK